MSDNTTINSGSGGDTISTDDIGGGVKVQRVKIQTGTDGTASDVSASNPLPISDNGSSVTVDGTVTATISGTPAVTISGTPNVAVSSLPALAAGTNNIGDVDVLTVPAPLSTTGSGTQATALRTTLATDSPLPASVTEDAVSAGDPVGLHLMARARVQPLADEVPAADVVALNATRKGALYVRNPNGDISAQTQFTATGNLDIDCNGHGVAVIDLIFSAATATIVFEGIFSNGAVTHSLQATNRATGAQETSATATGSWIVPLHGYTTLRVRCSAYTSGTIFTAACTSASSSMSALVSTSVHDAPGATINPHLQGGYASDTAPAAVSAAGDVVRDWHGLKGEQIARLVDGTGDSCMDNANDSLRVSLVAGGGAGGTSMTDDGSFTVGTSGITPAGGIYRSTRDLVDDGDGGALAMNQKRGLYTSPETPNGDSLADDTSDALKTVGPIAHDAANAGNHNPLLMGGRAADSPLAAVSADGDAAVMRLDRLGQVCSRLVDSVGDSCMDDANNALRVNIIAGAGSGGTAMTDDAAFTVGTTAFTPVGGTYRTARDNLDDNDGGAIAITQKRAMLSCLETPAGDSAMDDSLDAVKVSLVATSATLTTQFTLNEAFADITAAGQNVASTTGASSGASIEIIGTWVGTLQFEARATSGWVAVLAYPVGATTVPVTSTTANGVWQISGAGFGQIRVRASAWTSGTATVIHNRTSAGFAPSYVGTSSAVTVSSVPGTVVEDAASVGGETLMAIAAVRRDTAASSSGTDGDYSTLNVNASGRLYTSATVDAALPAGNNNIGDVDVVTLIPGTGATSLGKAEDAVHSSGDTGVAVLAVRTDTPGAGIGADGDYVCLRTDSTGNLLVNVATGGTGAVQGVDAHDAPITAAPVLVAARASAAAPANVSADGDSTELWALRSGALATQITAAGALVGGDATNGLDVDVTRVIPGTTATALGKAEDAAATDGDTGVLILAVRRDAASSGVSADGDYAALSVTSDGSLRVSGAGGGTQFAEDAASAGGDVMTTAGTVRQDTPASSTSADGDYQPLKTDSVGRLHVNGSGVTQPVSGTITASSTTGAAAHDAAVSGNPVLVGFEARTTDGTAVTSGDAVRPMASTLGKLVTLPGSIPENQTQGNLNRTNTTGADIIAAAGAGIKIAVMSVTVINKHATVSTTVSIRDSTTVKIGPLQCKADGGGFHMTGGGFPLFVTTANQAVTGICGTTGTDVDFFVSGYTTTD